MTLFHQPGCGKVDGEGRAFAQARLQMQSSFGFLDQALHDVQAQPRALLWPLGGEVGLEDLRQDLRRNPGTIVANRNLQERGGVGEVLHVQEPRLQPVFERGQVQRFLQYTAFDIDAVAPGRALKRIHGQVQQDLDQIRPVDFYADVFGQGLHGEFVVLQTRMHLDQVAEIGQELVDPDAWRFIRLLPQEAQVTSRNLDAVGDLAGDDLQAVFDELQVLHFEPACVVEALVHQLDETGDHRERAVDIVDDAGVNFPACVRDLLLDFLGLQLRDQFLQLFRVVVYLALQRPPLHRTRDGGTHGGNIKRLV